MRFALGSAATAAVLYAAAGLGAVGAWALPLSAIWLLVAATVGAIALEERDPAAAEGLITRVDEHNEPAADSWLEAA